MSTKKSKRDIDKELMYSKIMPSSAAHYAEESESSQAYPHPQVSDVLSAAKDEAQARLNETTLDQANSSEPPKAKETIEDNNLSESSKSADRIDHEEIENTPANQEDISEEISSLEQADNKNNSKTSSQQNIEESIIESVDINDNDIKIVTPENPKETVLINIKERMVMRKIEKSLEKFKCCKCYFCRQDVIAGALNFLPPKYMVVAREDIDAFIEKENDQEITSALIKAILYVRNHPRH